MPALVARGVAPIAARAPDVADLREAMSAAPAKALAEVYLSAIGVSKRFKSTVVLDSLDLGVRGGEFVSLLGPSGCGKTTLLRIIAGLARADRGQIVIAGRDVGALPAHKRNVGFVFQNYALFPHLSVAENVAFGLVEQRRSRAEIKASVQRTLALVQLETFGARSIAQLSGGQQQRVALARALAVKPSLILLDEPLSALDRNLREAMRMELRQLLREVGMTAIFVTHDQDEALVLSDRIAVMRAGRIEQFADPETVYARPATPYVLGFVGQSSCFAGHVVGLESGRMRIETAYGHLVATGGLAAGTRVMVAVRPEKMRLGAIAGLPRNELTLRLSDIVFLGSKRLFYFAANEGDRAILEGGDEIDRPVQAGQAVTVSWAIADTLVYPSPSGE